MATSRRYVVRTAGVLLALALAPCLMACGPEVDPPSKLSSLRVLAVKKDDPYLRVTPPSADAPKSGAYQPDNVASMTVAIDDARPRSERRGPLQKLWFAGCSNPPGDTYFSCLLTVWLSFKAFEALGPETLADGEAWGIDEADPADILKFVTDTFPDYVTGSGGTNGSTDTPAVSQEELIEQALAIRVGAGDTFDYQIPEWLIEKHTPSADKDIPLYGLSQVFFAACDGKMGLSPEWQGTMDPLTVLTDATLGFPLTCYDEKTKEPRGPDHFVVSYSNLYAYENISNKNPVISGATLDDVAVDPSALCIGAPCATDTSACANKRAPHIPRCDKPKSSDCKNLALKPVMDSKANREIDVNATNAEGGGGELLEQLWLRYYATSGEIANDAKRLQDANEGWFDDHGTKWRVPRTAGSVSLWAVAYDNRGGSDWVRVSVCVE